MALRLAHGNPATAAAPASPSVVPLRGGALVVGMALVLPCLAGCRSAARTPPGSSMNLTAVDGAFHDAPDAAISIVSPIYDPVAREINLICARNEVRGFFVRPASPGRSFPALAWSADPLRRDADVLDGAAIELYRVWSVELPKPPGWLIKAVDPSARRQAVPDALVPVNTPRSGRPPPGQMPLIWVDLTIPKSARPGRYRAMIRAHRGERQVAEVPLTVEVLDLALPDTLAVALLGPVDLQSLLGHHLTINGEPFAPDRLLQNGPLYEEALRLVQGTLLQLQRHRVNPILNGCYPILKFNADDEVVLKWDDYDALVGGFVDGGLHAGQPAAPFWPVPFDQTFPPPPPYEAMTSPNYTRTLRQYLALCEDHFQDKGWLDRTFVLLPGDTSYNWESFNRTRHYADVVRLGGRRLPVLCRLPAQDMGPYGWTGYPRVDLNEAVDIWCPPAQFYDRTVFGRARYRRTKAWLGLDRPPYSGTLDPSGGDTFARVIPWQADALGARAVLLPEVNRWNRDHKSAFATHDAAGGSAPLILPGRMWGLDQPVPTVRLKMLRRGMQDLAYLHVCRGRGLSDVADAVRRSLCRYAAADAYGVHYADGRFDGWEYDPQWWNHGRSLIVDALRDRSGSRGTAGFESLAWQRFFEATQHVHLVANGSRVSVESDPAHNAPAGFTVELSLTLHNQTRGPLSGTISWGALPLGWQGVRDDQALQAVPPEGSRAVTLTAQTTAMSPGEDGQIRVPVVLEFGGQAASRTYWIEVAHITVPRLSERIELDGNLSDWPPGIGNVVGNFRDISHRLRPGETPADNIVPGTQAVGLVCRDSEYLYFLFHCPTAQRLPRADALKNFLTYDDGLPVGEELVEILIDPSNGRSNSPADLFHVAVKPSGVVLAERGIRSKPPVGFAEDWPADVRVAAQQLKDRWIAEVRIPLQDFGPEAARQRTWGVNFCRFDTAAWTYRNWSGAQWNTYNPMSLGNMTFAD